MKLSWWIVIELVHRTEYLYSGLSIIHASVLEVILKHCLTCGTKCSSRSDHCSLRYTATGS